MCLVARRMHHTFSLWLAAVAITITAEAWRTLESESQYYQNEAKDEQRHVSNADDLPAAEPSLTIPAKSLESRPETVGQMEPESCEPNEIEHHEERVGECLDNPTEAVGRIALQSLNAKQLSKHHVVPEVVQMQKDAEQDNKTEHKHVLRRPLHLSSIYRR